LFWSIVSTEEMAFFGLSFSYCVTLSGGLCLLLEGMNLFYSNMKELLFLKFCLAKGDKERDNKRRN
jgi:hypothetical protein